MFDGFPAGTGEQSRANVSKLEVGGSRPAGGGEQSRANVPDLTANGTRNSATTTGQHPHPLLATNQIVGYSQLSGYFLIT